MESLNQSPRFYRGARKNLNFSHQIHFNGTWEIIQSYIFILFHKKNGYIYQICTNRCRDDTDIDDREGDKERSKWVYFLISVICVFSVYMIYSNKIFLKNENMLTTISCDSAHMVIGSHWKLVESLRSWKTWFYYPSLAHSRRTHQCIEEFPATKSNLFWEWDVYFYLFISDRYRKPIYLGQIVPQILCTDKRSQHHFKIKVYCKPNC